MKVFVVFGILAVITLSPWNASAESIQTRTVTRSINGGPPTTITERIINGFIKEYTVNGQPMTESEFNAWVNGRGNSGAYESFVHPNVPMYPVQSGHAQYMSSIHELMEANGGTIRITGRNINGVNEYSTMGRRISNAEMNAIIALHIPYNYYQEETTTTPSPLYRRPALNSPARTDAPPSTTTQRPTLSPYRYPNYSPPATSAPTHIPATTTTTARPMTRHTTTTGLR